MANSLIKYLNDQPLLTVLRGFLLSSEPRHLRDLSRQYLLSASGVADIIRRLKGLGILKEVKIMNMKCYSLILSQEEEMCLKRMFLTYQQVTIQERAQRLSDFAHDRFVWMDEARALYKNTKSKRS